MYTMTVIDLEETLNSLCRWPSTTAPVRKSLESWQKEEWSMLSEQLKKEPKTLPVTSGWVYSSVTRQSLRAIRERLRDRLTSETVLRYCPMC